MATVEQRHREDAAEVFMPGPKSDALKLWAATGEGEFSVVSRIAQVLADAEQRGAEAAHLETGTVVRALGEWAQRQLSGDVCWPQPMHDGTLRIYASKCAGTTPYVAQGVDFLSTARALLVRLREGK